MATWEVITERLRFERERTEAEADTTAVNKLLSTLSAATDVEQAVQTALDTVRGEFGWAYGSFWKIDPADRTLKFDRESGDAGPEFRRVTLQASFAEGVGLSGRAWAQRDLYFTPDIGEMTDCVRAPVAQQVGVKSGVCFPIIVSGEVVGTMDFFATETLQPSNQRLEALRNVGRLVSQAIARIERESAEREAAAVIAAKVAQILDVVSAAAAGDLTREPGHRRRRRRRPGGLRPAHPARHAARVDGQHRRHGRVARRGRRPGSPPCPRGWARAPRRPPTARPPPRARRCRCPPRSRPSPRRRRR
ncbi:GAF domain-containing protein [Nocardioides sp. W3-2-3]|nr:GAF domain-containing protein [Nocardioides convexus]